MFIFITFILGKQSPYYQDTLTYTGEDWDYCRNTNIDAKPIIQMIHCIFSKSIEMQIDNNFDNKEKEKDLNNTNKFILISERDLNCIRNTNFLNIVYRTEKKIYSDFIANLSKFDKEFSIKICYNLINLLDGISLYSPNDIIDFINIIIPLLEIEDDYQLLRFEIILGYPQMIIEEATIENKMANFGYHNMTDVYNKIIEIKNTIDTKNTICLMKKIYDCYSKEKVFIEIFMNLIQAAVLNPALLKYLRAFISCSDDFIGEE